MRKVALLKKDEIVINKNDIVNLLTICKSAFRNGSNAMIWFETENQRQQEIRDDYCQIFNNRADLIEKFMSGLE